jgi:hypothetical protein
MMYRALTIAVLSLSTFAFSQQANTINVLTRMNDNQHTGQNLQETILTPSNVNSTSFGKIFSYPVDGQVYAQPLYVQNLTMAKGGVHNVVFVATEYDSVYAFDADSSIANPQPLWHVNFLNPPAIQPVACSEGSGICQLYPLVGITATPVIDLATNTIYVEVRTQEISNGVTNWVQRLHALNITSGAEQPNSPVVICSAQGRNGCALSNESSTVIFGPGHQQSRVGTMLVPEPGFPQGVYFIGFSGDSGWVLAYDPVSLQLLAGWYTDDEQVHTSAFLNAPGAANNWVGAGFGVTMPGIFPGIPGEGHSGVWGAGTGISADANGYVYAITGDGYWDGSVNWGDSLVKLQLQYNSSTKTYSLVPVDYFTTSDQACRYAHGLDYGSAGPLILPTQPGATYPNLIFTTGKQVKTCESTFEGYVINANNMGHVGGQVSQMSLSNGGGEQPAAYWYNGTTQYIYNGSDGDALRAYTLSAFDSGLNPVVSANGTQNGIVWGLERIDDPDEYQPGTSPWVLHAFNANTLAELYNTTQASAGRDTPGPNLKMTVPTVANGKVYVPTQTELDIYGLCPCPATH